MQQLFKEEGVKEAVIEVIRLIKIYSASSSRKREFLHLQSQEKLLNSLFKEDKFTLIILDACRYDYFEKVYPFFLNGNLQAVKSPSSYTIDWLRTIFGKFGKYLSDLTIYSAQPYINSKRIQVHGFRAKDYLKGKIIDVWKTGWDSQFGTVPPDAVIDAVEEEGLNDKNMIWFMQPHIPYLNAPNISRKQRVIKKSLRTGKISKEYLSWAYEENLRIALRSIKRFLERERNLEGRLIITSDHGEILGEYGIFGHPNYLNYPEQRVVPWLSIE